MKKLLIFASLLFTISIFEINAQNRKSVSAAEAGGTFRSFFDGKFKGNYNEIKILALGNGKLRVAFELTYPYIDGTGGLMANVCAADGTAIIEGDTAVFSPDENGQCKIEYPNKKHLHRRHRRLLMENNCVKIRLDFLSLCQS